MKENKNQGGNTRENIAAGGSQIQTAETRKELLLTAEHTERDCLEKLAYKQKLCEIARNEPSFSIRVNQVAMANPRPASNRGFTGVLLFSGFAMALGTGVFSSGLSTQSVLASIADLEPLLAVPIIGVVPAKDRSSDPFARRRRRTILRWASILSGGLIILGSMGGVYWFFAQLGS